MNDWQKLKLSALLGIWCGTVSAAILYIVIF